MKKAWSGVCAAVCACVIAFSAAGCTRGEQEDVVILFTTDVHCNFEDNIGYSGLAAYRDQMLERTPHVALVDCGDAIQGNYYGSISKGEYAVQLMNAVGYDYAAIGNHDFDYGMARLSEVIEQSSAQYLACNISYTGRGESALTGVQPYALKEYGDTTIAFLGVSTPESIVKSVPSYFMEDGEYVYDFYAGEEGARLTAKVQSTVDSAREAGAEYVVALTHLGDDVSSFPYTSSQLATKTHGIDLILDGHAHASIPCRALENARGEEVLLSAAGTELSCIGQAVITANGLVSVGLVIDYAGRDEKIDALMQDIHAQSDAQRDAVVGTSATELPIAAGGVRLVRNRECALGNFVADAYRAISGAEIAIVNGGGIRAALPKGEVTFGDVLTLHPYGNTLCSVRATGAQILDALELGCRATLAQSSNGENAVGESGGFLQVSGLKYTIDTAVASTVLTDAAGMFTGVAGARRVKDVFVLQGGAYVPLQADKTYTVASHNYLMRDCGDGFTMFRDCEFVIGEGILDYQIIIDYIQNVLGGTIGSEYMAPQGRISVV